MTERAAYKFQALDMGHTEGSPKTRFSIPDRADSPPIRVKP
jgi:hypothetical protein